MTDAHAFVVFDFENGAPPAARLRVEDAVKRTLCAAAWAVVMTVSASAVAEPECGAIVTRDDVVRCVLRESLTVRAEARTGEALEARRTAVSPLLPSNPVLSLSGARRDGDGQRATNWSATLAQEVEIAGQRGARRRAAELHSAAQGHRIVAARRDAAAAAWIAYFEALAAGDEVRLSARLATIATQIATVARGMADRGLLSPVDADVADATRVGIEQTQLAAQRRARGTQLALTTLLGLDPTRAVSATGELAPLRGIDEEARAAAAREPSDRPEVQAFEAERRAQEATATAYARARVPNPTISAFAQNDGFNERVLGVGLSIPIPVPQPVGRLYNGEIAEANALAARAATQAERVRRQTRADILDALAEYEMRKLQREAFTEERLVRADQGIDAIAREIQAGRLAIRDALVAQQALVSLLRASVEARLALCIASVELARAAGVSLERGSR